MWRYLWCTFQAQLAQVFYIPLNCSMAVYTSVYSVYSQNIVKMKKTVCIGTHTTPLSTLPCNLKSGFTMFLCVYELMLSAGLHTPAGIANSPAPLESRQIRCNLRCVLRPDSLLVITSVCGRLVKRPILFLPGKEHTVKNKGSKRVIEEPFLVSQRTSVNSS